MRALVVIALLGAACGRVGYDAEALDSIPGTPDSGSGADGDIAISDAAPTDAAVDASVLTPIDAAPPPIDAAAPPIDAAPPITTVNGNYAMGAPVQYSCALGLVDINLLNVSLVDNSSTLTITTDDVGAPPQPCAMQGASAEGSGNINVSCTLPGGCDEIYTITGSFTDPDHWSGTLTVDFVGRCLDCVNQDIPLSASRCAGGAPCPASPFQ